MLLQAFYGIRSERQLMERVEFDLLFRWFVGLGVDEAVWDHSSFTTNRERLLSGEIAAKFLRAVLPRPKVKRLISSEHFSVDGALIEAGPRSRASAARMGATMIPRGRDQRRAQHPQGEALQRNACQHDRSRGAALQEGRWPASQALLYRPYPNGESQRPGGGWRHHPGWGTTERVAALAMVERRKRSGRVTLGADKAYDVRQFVEDLRKRAVTAHIAIDGHLTKTSKMRTTAIDQRTTRHPGYEISQRCRKRIKEVFGWAKGSAGLAKVKLRGQAKVDAVFTLALAAYNLIRLPKLLGALV